MSNVECPITNVEDMLSSWKFEIEDSTLDIFLVSSCLSGKNKSAKIRSIRVNPRSIH